MRRGNPDGLIESLEHAFMNSFQVISFPQHLPNVDLNFFWTLFNAHNEISEEVYKERYKELLSR